MFVDRLQLIAVDHPADVEVYPNEGLKARPSGVRAHDDARRQTGRARDEDDGHDVTARVAAVDRSYPDGFRARRHPRICRDRTR